MAAWPQDLVDLDYAQSVKVSSLAMRVARSQRERAGCVVDVKQLALHLANELLKLRA